MLQPGRHQRGHFDGGFHYVELIDSGPGYVELRFVATSWPSWFEYRIDDVSPSSGTAHPTIAGEFIHPNVAVSAGNSTTRIFSGSFVDIRSAFGPERDWDFDWTRFNIPAVAPVPLPAGLPLLVAGLGLFGVLRVRRG